jgi:hypothetical protein
MEKNMSRIQPRTLSTQELIRFCADFIQDEDGLPKDWQIELLRRITILAPEHEHSAHDPRQRDLFLQN